MTDPTTSTYPATAAGLAAALAALGDTADAVAEALTWGGHTGRPGSTENCPGARYLAAVIPTGVDIAVGEEEAELNTTAAGELVRVDLPTAVAAFIAAFDLGGYDHLADYPDDDEDH